MLARVILYHSFCPSCADCRPFSKYWQATGTGMEQLECVQMWFVNCPGEYGVKIYYLRSGISNEVIYAAAVDFTLLGFQDAGYEYINIDVRFDFLVVYAMCLILLIGLLGGDDTRSDDTANHPGPE